MVTHWKDFQIVILNLKTIASGVRLCNQILNTRSIRQIWFMMTSLNGNISALLALCEGNHWSPMDSPQKRPVTRSFDVFFDLSLKRQLSKQSRRWSFETPSHSLWCHCKVLFILDLCHSSASTNLNACWSPGCLQYYGHAVYLDWI